MKIGILTLHSQQNYGGVLQCYALKETLKSLGHKVVVIDRWVDPRCYPLFREFTGKSLLATILLYAKVFFRIGGYKNVVRTLRSIRFVRSLGLSRYHFHHISEAPEDLGVDLVVVGSDQVWHCGDWGDPETFLLDGVKGRIKHAIAYAASFGMKSIPDDKSDLYNRGLRNFKAISCREAEGVDLCRGLGVEASHVVDPTLLLGRQQWQDLVRSRSQADRPKLTCYLLGINIEEILQDLEEFAVANNCNVEVMFNAFYPNKFKTYKGRVRMCNDYGPREFVEAFATATWVLTDSFHAVMFSYIFKKDMRFLKPTGESRRGMFMRIKEFASKCIIGEPFVDDVKSACLSFVRDGAVEYREDVINRERNESLNWLQTQLMNFAEE